MNLCYAALWVRVGAFVDATRHSRGFGNCGGGGGDTRLEYKYHGWIFGGIEC